jgi:SAM-dependent methyltransferase
VDRLHWGCGPNPPQDWTNSDIERWPGLPIDHVGAIQDGLPYLPGAFDYVATHHALQMVPWPDLVPALSELRRVTRPGGWLRVSVPNMLAAVYALRIGDSSWFPISDNIEASVDGKFCVYVTQAGATRSVFTPRHLADVVERAGWRPHAFVWAGVTDSPTPGICDLDSRDHESIYLEAQCPE